MNNLDLLRPVAVFAAVVEEGSFRAAADSLGLSPPYVSQMVSELEARLGRQLLYRSTRKIALTDEGEAFLAHARAMSDSFRDGLDSVARRKRRLTGRLCVAAPTVVAGSLFAKVVAGFTADHPEVALELLLDDHLTDPVVARVDLAIRIGNPGDDPRLARKLFQTRGTVLCAPAQADEICSPQDLADVLWLRTPQMGKSLVLTGPEGRTTFAPKRQMVLNNAAMIDAVLAEGQGFAVFPDFSRRDAVASGALATPLPDHATPPVPAYALFTERRTELTNARAFVEHLVTRLAGEN
jgi:DNA-binding transcriptional LysR family regulator